MFISTCYRVDPPRSIRLALNLPEHDLFKNTFTFLFIFSSTFKKRFDNNFSYSGILTVSINFIS